MTQTVPVVGYASDYRTYHGQDRTRRNFNPRKTRRYGRATFNPEELVKYSPKWQYARLMNFPYPGAHWQPRMRTVVISVDGGSLGNNRADPTSRAAYGVYFGPESRYNKYGRLDPSEVQTNSRAELEAVRQALLTVQQLSRSGELDGWREVIIKTDSSYVASSLSNDVWKWENNGWKTRKGAVVHAELMIELHELIKTLEADMAIRFWRVGREFNKEADELVKQAFAEENREASA